MALTLGLSSVALPACPAVLEAFVVAANVVDIVRRWISDIESTIPAIPLEREQELELRQNIVATRTALAALERVANTADAQRCGELERAKVGLVDAYTTLFESARRNGLLSDAATSLGGPSRSNRVGTPGELAASLKEGKP